MGRQQQQCGLTYPTNMLFKTIQCILNIHVMYLNFRIRLLELEAVSSKQTYLWVVEQLITEYDLYQQVARENCECY